MPSSDQILVTRKGESKEDRIQRLAETVRLNLEFQRVVGKQVFDPRAKEKAVKAFQKIESE